MRSKIIYLQLFLWALASCSQPSKEQQKTIGNWHSGILELVINPDSDSLNIEYNYSEYYFDENYMYSYSNSLNDFYTVPYFFKEDSLFYSSSNNQDFFVGVVNYPNDSTQFFSSKTDTTRIYQIKTDDKTLNNFINPDTESLKTFINKEEYLKFFEDRYQKVLDSHLKNKN